MVTATTPQTGATPAAMWERLRSGLRLLPADPPAGRPLAPVPRDRLVAFAPAIQSVRWGVAAVSTALTVPYFIVADWWVSSWWAVLIVATGLRTFRPLSATEEDDTPLRLLADLGITGLAVAMTGFFDSPLVFALVVPTVVAGFARGFPFAARIAATSIASVALAAAAVGAGDESQARTTSEWAVVLLMIAIVSGYARRITGEANRQHSLALDRLGDKLDKLSDDIGKLSERTAKLEGAAETKPPLVQAPQ